MQDAGDPVLNASILVWNATVVPFSDAWWNAPHFYPSPGVAALTENLVGLSPIASPLYWMTGAPIAAYNLTLFLTWPLSALAVYLLVCRLTRHPLAGFVAGLGFGFSPYRFAELGHLQMLATFGLPFMMLGAHAYLDDRRARWLALVAAAWLQQTLSNGYMLLFGSVFFALWLLYFGTRRETRRAAAALVATWIAASLAIAPVLFVYRDTLEWHGLERSLTFLPGFSYPLASFFGVAPSAWFWSAMLPDNQEKLFPGATLPALVLVGIWWAWRRQDRSSIGPAWVRTAAAVLAVTGASISVVTMIVGAWQIDFGVSVLRVTDLNRAVMLTLGSAAVLAATTPALRGILGRRSVLLFYTAAAVLMALFSLGPVVRAEDEHVLFNWAPYRFLLSVPGFDQLRVPVRFWMLGVFSLSVAAGIAASRLRSRGVLVLLGVGILLEGWPRELPMERAPSLDVQLELRRPQLPLLELPLGDGWDAPATLRAVVHRRRVVNGVSGYDPLNYAPLREALAARDPTALMALSTLGEIDVVVRHESDPDGAIGRYVASVPGASGIAPDQSRRVFRLPARPSPPAPGPAWPIATASAGAPGAELFIDDRPDTEWRDAPQHPKQWVQIDLGTVRDVGGVTHALGPFARDYPVRLAIDLSTDAQNWITVWEGPTAGLAFLAATREPLVAPMEFTFPSQRARFVRLRQTGARERQFWRVAELRAHAPR